MIVNFEKKEEREFNHFAPKRQCKSTNRPFCKEKKKKERRQRQGFYGLGINELARAHVKAIFDHIDKPVTTIAISNLLLTTTTTKKRFTFVFVAVVFKGIARSAARRRRRRQWQSDIKGNSLLRDSGIKRIENEQNHRKKQDEFYLAQWSWIKRDVFFCEAIKLRNYVQHVP